ncbi:MAG: hypothetical protein WC916_03845 [Candidatus Woesearchaeota archaeon]
MNRKDYLIIGAIILGAVLLLLIPLAMRALQGNYTIAGGESYHQLWLFEGRQGANQFIDPMTGTSMPINIIHFVSSSSPLLFIGVMTFLGALTLILFTLLLREHAISTKNSIIILLLLATSPIFIYLFSGITIYAFSIVLTLLAFLLLSRKLTFFGIIPLIILPFVDFYWALFTLLILIVYMVGTGSTPKSFTYALLFLVSAIIASFIGNATIGHDLFTDLVFSGSSIITDIGADPGFSFSMIILSIVGLVLLWERGLRNVFVYAIIGLFIFGAFFNNLIRIYLGFILVIYAGFAFSYLKKRKWSIQLIKKTTLLLILCAILFSTLFYVTKIIRSEPTSEFIDATQFIATQSQPGEVVFTTPENAYLVTYYTKLETFINPVRAEREPLRLVLFENITVSRTLEYTQSVFTQNHVRYIFIDQSFEDYLNGKNGLIFLMQTSQSFVKVYENEGFTVWMYTG